MDFIIFASRYALPTVTLLIMGMCVFALWIGHPAEKTYAYLINMNDGETYPISMWETSIGRGRYCDIVLTNAKVTASNAVLTRRIDGWYIHDLDVKFPIKVNGTVVEEKSTIADGDIITIGGLNFRFEVIDDPVQNETRRARRAQMKALKKQQAGDRARDIQEEAANTRRPQQGRTSQQRQRPQSDTPRPRGPRQGYKISNDTANIYFKSPASGEIPRFNANKTVTIGSSPRADIRINEAGVMGIHGRIVHYREGWAIERAVDCQISVNGRRIAQRKLLKSGDVITIGSANVSYNQR